MKGGMGWEGRGREGGFRESLSDAGGCGCEDVRMLGRGDVKMRGREGKEDTKM